jgi:hypothetical protein
MNPHLYRVRFVGGPADGVIVVTTSFSLRDKLWMPAGSAAGTNYRDMAASRCSAAYRLSRQQHTVKDGFPTVLYEFEFAGFESNARPSVSKSRPRSRSRWLSRLSTAISRCWVGLAAWMMAPIDHPLILSETANIHSGSSRREELTAR